MVPRLQSDWEGGDVATPSGYEKTLGAWTRDYQSLESETNILRYEERGLYLGSTWSHTSHPPCHVFYHFGVASPGESVVLGLPLPIIGMI